MRDSMLQHGIHNMRLRLCRDDKYIRTMLVALFEPGNRLAAASHRVLEQRTSTAARPLRLRRAFDRPHIAPTSALESVNRQHVRLHLIIACALCN